MSKRIVQQIVDMRVPQIPKQIVEVILTANRVFFLTACGKGTGRHVPHELPHSPHPHARVDSECKRWNLEHVVLDLFSHFTVGKVQDRWLFVSCRGSRSPNSPFALSRLANLTADSPQHRAAGWRFIDWNEVEQRGLLAEAKRLLETGEL